MALNWLDMVKDIRIEDFDYELPEDRIPRHPLEKRDECRLLLSRPDGKINHLRFKALPSLLPPGSMLVCNDTKVINARLTFVKDTGARIEVFLLKPDKPADYVQSFQTTERCVWSCMVGNLKRWKEGPLSITIDDAEHGKCILTAHRLDAMEGNAHRIEFSWDNPSMTFASVVECAGRIPIPPYLKRESEERDNDDYQTVYADARGSVAAPTAGLHFTEPLFDDLRAHNIKTERVTLHVGAGTFQPVKSDTIGEHPMHTETFSITRPMIHNLRKHKEAKLPIIAVGTTTVRTLESLPYLAKAISEGKVPHVEQWTAYEEKSSEIDTTEALRYLEKLMEERGTDTLTASTAIMIAPGFNWRITDAMVTNFHQPQSTLLLLVSSFLGDNANQPQWRKIYKEALDGDYRFLSYGDASLLFPLKT